MTNSIENAATFTLGGDLQVRRLGFGAMRITGKGVWHEPQDHDECIRVLRRVVELGINLIDTSDAYGPEVSERLIAEALYPYSQDLVIATKGGFLRGGPNNWIPEGHPQHLREALEGSLKRLKLERIDLYQLHTVDSRVPIEELVGALVDMQKQGKIRHIALCNVDTKQLERARKIATIVSVQNRYNLSDRSSEAVLEMCEQEGLGFLPWFPLATGQLAQPGGKLDQVAKNHGATQSQVALAWLLHRSPVMLPIPGTSTVKHLEENFGAAQLQLTADEFRTLGA